MTNSKRKFNIFCYYLFWLSVEYYTVFLISLTYFLYFYEFYPYICSFKRNSEILKNIILSKRYILAFTTKISGYRM